MKIYCRMETGFEKNTIEDRVLVGDTILAGGQYFLDTPACSAPFSIAIADGVGGNNAGNIAAHVAVEGFASIQLPVSIPNDDRIDTLREIINSINLRIIEKSKTDHRLFRMATTLSGLCYMDEKWYLIHVGNSRIYTYLRPRLKQITTDHSWASEMRQRAFSDEVIQNSGRASEISSCLGNGDPSSADQLVIKDVTEMVSSAELLLFTTDGVHDYIAKDMLEVSVRNIQRIDTYISQAMEFARANGSTDDLSMLIVDLREN